MFFSIQLRHNSSLVTIEADTQDVHASMRDGHPLRAKTLRGKMILLNPHDIVVAQETFVGSVGKPV